MRAPLYDEVLGLALDIVNASGRNDEKIAAKAYAELRNLCERNEGGNQDHPLQWEALGDFSKSHSDTLRAYEKGLHCALRLDLPEYTASIKFAMAESYCDQGDLNVAGQLAHEAAAEAEKTNDRELRAAIEEFLAELSNT